MSPSSNGIPPHGGRLVNRLVREDEAPARRERARQLPRLLLKPREVADIVLLGVGAFSPLEGFMTAVDYHEVVARGRLASGLPWTLPVTLSVSREFADQLPTGHEIALHDADTLLATLELHEKFGYDAEREALGVYGTTDDTHPGVAYLRRAGSVLLGGPITLIALPTPEPIYEGFVLQPAQTREAFAKRGWRSVVAFQTRNPIHRAHEYIQRCALETVDGLLIHPLVGETKADDIPPSIRMRCYRAVIDHYYPKDRVLLSVFPAAMRYAGPREAIFHALVRKNYGCTHIVIGRDHAGVGSFYGPYDAQRAFEHYTEEEIGIRPLFFDATFHCRRCGQIVSQKTCPHPEADRLVFNGTIVRERLARGEDLPVEFTRPEVAAILREAYTPSQRPGVAPAGARGATSE